jgi:hypothetical protein
LELVGMSEMSSKVGVRGVRTGDWFKALPRSGRINKLNTKFMKITGITEDDRENICGCRSDFNGSAKVRSPYTEFVQSRSVTIELGSDTNVIIDHSEMIAMDNKKKFTSRKNQLASVR